MLKSKLIEILRSFSQLELKEFESFVQSPYFNKRAEIIALYRYLYEKAPLFEANEINREIVYCNVFPGKEYDEKQIGYLMSYLSKLAERFLSIQKYEKDQLLPDYHILSTYLERNLFKQYEQASSKLNKSTENTRRDINSYYKSYLLSELGDRHFVLKKQWRYDDNLQNTVDNLDYFYVFNKLKYSCSMIDRQKILSFDYNFNFLDDIIQYVENSSLLNEPLIAFYFQILNTLKEGENPVHFAALKNLLFEFSGLYDRTEIYEVYQYAINYCARKSRMGDDQYVEEALNLYIDGIEKGVFIEDNVLAPSVFTNCVRSALRLKKYNFVESFIEKYGTKLSKEHRQNTIDYSFAELYYYTRDLNKSLDHLTKVRFSDFSFDIGSRVLLAKIYYETKEEDALLSLIASFSIFLKRKKNISNALRKPSLNFCDFVFLFVRRQPKKIINVKEKINETKLLVDRTWLLQQADILLEELKLK